MNFKFISALYGAAASLAILTAGGVEAASYSAPVAQQQQVLIAQSNISQTTVGEGGWIEGGETDEYSYASFSFEHRGVTVNVIQYSDGLQGRLILNDDHTGVYATVPEDGSLPVESKITWDLYANGNLVFGDDTFHAWFTNAGDFAIN